LSHTTEIVEYKKISNGQVSCLIRCCGNASTDHWHTMAVSVASDPVARAASLAPQRDFVANQHEQANKAESGMIDEVNAPPKEHS
jgi:hypothetical protein